MKALCLCVVLFCMNSLSAQTVKLPSTLTGEPGLPIQVIAEADGKNVTWFTPDPGIVLIDGGFFNGDSKRAIVFGSQPGSFRVWAVTAKGDIVSPKVECIITIGPSPGPGPNPFNKPGTITVPNLSGVSFREAVQALNKLGLDYVASGDILHRIRDHSPSAGSSVLSGSKVTLNFDP